MEDTTTRQSSIFQPSLRYAFGCRIRPSATILSTISTKNTMVKTNSRTLSTAILDLVLQHPGAPADPHGGNALPKKGPSSRGQLIISACPRVAAPVQSRKPGAGGQLLSDDTTTSSGASSRRVMEETRMTASMSPSTTGCLDATAAQRRSGLEGGKTKKALWSATGHDSWVIPIYAQELRCKCLRLESLMLYSSEQAFKVEIVETSRGTGSVTVTEGLRDALSSPGITDDS
mmetsp:Transcript_81076/g.217788  ORF Transcript_81076/g.217788 Transcript_81076/m.217788 type:complete len:231 (+) Transcript_81076:296-988(+)